MRLLALVLASTACGARTPTASRAADASAAVDAPPPDGTVVSPPAQTFAVVLDDCGPSDGPAWVLRASGTALSCSLAESVPRDEIAVYASLPVAPATIVVTSGSGLARWCSAPTVCSESTNATVEVTSITKSEMRGSYRITFKDQTRAGAFVAKVCHNGAMCG